MTTIGGDGFEERLREAGATPVDLEARHWRASVARRLFGAGSGRFEIGRHTVLERIGAGGTGVVYAAYDPELDRKVALKLIRREILDEAQGTNAWLAREAKALAKLSHPNVVPVYDVGTHDGQVFVTLEFVTGSTLRQWMQSRRPLAEIVDVFAQAARGLAAAHEAGLVHRDFKPENVLIGEDGRVRVSDFGIARRVRADEAPPTLPPAGAEIDETFAHAGTPAYMAPEQFRGTEVGPRTDQFAFCVALHEAVYGQRPFEGDDRTTLAENVAAGRRTVPPTELSPPRWLERILARGLSVDPDARFASMEALLHELTRDRRRHGWRWMAALAVASTVAATIAAAQPGAADPATACDRASELLDAVWNPKRRAAVQRAFAATDLAYADDTSERVVQAIDGYGTRWLQAHDDACRVEQPDEIRVERIYCLQTRLLDLKSVGDVFAEADAQIVEHAVAGVTALRDPAECMYAGASSDAALDGSGNETSALRLDIARAKALGAAGKPREARSLATEAAARATELSNRSLEAEALLVVATTEADLVGVLAEADPTSTAHAAVLAAEAAHRPDLLARALVERLAIDVALGHYDRIEARIRRARQAVRSIGNPAELVGRIHYCTGLALHYRGETEAARREVEAAVEAFDSGDANAHRWLSAATNFLGECTFEQGHYTEALPDYERALQIVLDEVGPEHPWAASAHGNMAEIFFLSGRYDEARRHFETALDVRLAAYGEASIWVVHTLAHLGDVQLQLGRPQQALATYERALSARRGVRGPLGLAPDRDIPGVFTDLQFEQQRAWIEHGLALALLELGRVDEAMAHAEAATGVPLPADRHHPDLTARLDVRGRVLLAAGDAEAALADLNRARAKLEAHFGPKHRTLAWTWTAAGEACLAMDRAEDAAEAFERALAIRSKLPDAFARDMARARFGLARALWSVGDQRARAIALARDAQSDLRRSADATKSERADVDAWLRGKR